MKPFYASFGFLIAVLLLTPPTAYGRPDYPGYVDAASKNLYGATASFTASCNGCHGQNYDIVNNGTGFGKDLRAAAVSKGISPPSITSDQMQSLISYIENMDSDGDGATNKQELSSGTNPGDSASVPVLCQRANPVIALSPSSQTGASGAVLTYSLSVKNADSSACTSSTFNVAATPASGLMAELSMQSVVLSPGQATTVSVKVTSALGLPDGKLSFSAGAQNAGAPTYQASAIATYTVLNPVVPVCVRAAPSLVISAPSQAAYAGETISYQATLKNQDSAECASSTFALSLVAASPLSGSLSGNSLSLSPGQSMNFNISVISAMNSSPGAYNLTVSANDAAVASHSASASASYNVKAPADTAAPSAPANLAIVKVKSVYQASWAASSDNIGVVGYNIYIDGVLKAQSTTTSAKLRIRRGLHSITVTALDASGNESAASLAVEVLVGK